MPAHFISQWKCYDELKEMSNFAPAFLGVSVSFCWYTIKKKVDVQSRQFSPVFGMLPPFYYHIESCEVALISRHPKCLFMETQPCNFENTHYIALLVVLIILTYESLGLMNFLSTH